jgi:hypothetical protein
MMSATHALSISTANQLGINAMGGVYAPQVELRNAIIRQVEADVFHECLLGNTTSYTEYTHVITRVGDKEFDYTQLTVCELGLFFQSLDYDQQVRVVNRRVTTDRIFYDVTVRLDWNIPKN